MTTPATTATDTTAAKTSVWLDHVGRLPRYIALALVLVATLSAAVFLYRECIEETTKAVNGEISVVTTCSPPSLSSAVLLLVLLIVAGLLWPDLAEVTVLGVGLKRDVREAVQTAATAQEGVQTLTRVIELHQVRLDAVAIATASAHVTTTVNFGPAESAQLKEAAARTEEDAKPLNLDKPDLDPIPDDTLGMQVIGEWERLDELLDFTGARARADRLGAYAERRKIEQAFIDDHAQSIRIARELRNAVAHARPVSRQNLLAGASLLQDLVGLARNWFDDHELVPRE